MISRWLLALVLSVSFALPVHAQDDYPNQPVRLVLPFPPGGGTDALARILADAMTESMGQQVVVDNRPGAAGNIASDTVAKAEPDGYTLLLGFSTALVVNPSLYEDLAFDVEEDFDPITLIADAQYILVVHPSVPAESVDELIAHAKENPGELNFSSSGVGGPLHLAAELFKTRADVDIVHIPYDGGGPAAQAVLGGEVDILFGSVAATKPQVEEGQLRALATTGLERSDAMPDLPTLDEAGLEGFNVTSWYALLAPAGTPEPIIDKLNDEVLKALSLPEVQERLAERGLTPIGSTPEELAQHMEEERKVWSEVIERAGLEPAEE